VFHVSKRLQERPRKIVARSAGLPYSNRLLRNHALQRWAKVEPRWLKTSKKRKARRARSISLSTKTWQSRLATLEPRRRVAPDVSSRCLTTAINRGEAPVGGLNARSDGA